MHTLSNLPPGVAEGMIPGNRPEDTALEKVVDWIWTIDRLDAYTLQEIVLKWCEETGNKPEDNPPLEEQR